MVVTEYRIPSVTFRDWLLAEASNDLRQLKSLVGTSKTKPR